MSTLLDIFYDDHEHALKELDKLQVQLEDIKQNGNVKRVKLQLVSFSKFLEVALDVHFVQEEEALFPILSQKIGSSAGPVLVMEQEHEKLRASQKALKSELKSENPDKDAVLRYAGYILEVLRDHIQKENQVLFPMSKQMLTEEEWKQAEDVAAKVILK